MRVTPVNLKRGELVYHEEDVAKSGDISIGIGEDIVFVTGMTSRQIANLVLPLFHDMINGGAHSLKLTRGAEIVMIYARRRKGIVDVGTRKDFAKLGWEAICDLIDAGNHTHSA